LGYAMIRREYALYALFLIDNVLFSFNVGFTTYLNRIVRRGELTPCLAMGTTMNHIAAVRVPFGGALLWQKAHHYQLPFRVGVAAGAAAAYEALHGKGTNALILGAGAAYAGKKYEDARKAQTKESGRRYGSRRVYQYRHGERVGYDLVNSRGQTISSYKRVFD